MTWIVTKYLITALMVVLVSEAAKHGDRIGGIVAALPMVTVLTLIWLHIEHQPGQKIANHAWYTFWYVIPTLPAAVDVPAPNVSLRLLARTGGLRICNVPMFRPVCSSNAPLRHRIAVMGSHPCPAGSPHSLDRLMQHEMPALSG